MRDVKSYAIFWSDETEEWPTQAFFGIWLGVDEEDALERSNILEGRPKATLVAIMEWNPILFRRSKFERTNG